MHTIPTTVLHPVTLHLSSRQLRRLVRDAVSLTYERFDDEPFKESSHDDGMLTCSADGAYDEFSVCVPIRQFLAARFGVPHDAITLEWSSYEWRYRATVRGVLLTQRERQRLAEYEEAL